MESSDKDACKRKHGTGRHNRRKCKVHRLNDRILLRHLIFQFHEPSEINGTIVGEVHGLIRGEASLLVNMGRIEAREDDGGELSLPKKEE